MKWRGKVPPKPAEVADGLALTRAIVGPSKVERSEAEEPGPFDPLAGGGTDPELLARIRALERKLLGLPEEPNDG